MRHTTRILRSALIPAVVAAALLGGTPDRVHASVAAPGLPLVAPVLEGKLNVNTATAKQWEMLPGVGPATSKRILAYRAKHPFKARNNIMRVKGVGKKTFAKIKDYLIVEGQTTLRIAK